MYIAELAPKRIRGGLVSFNQLAIVTGILLAYIVNFAIKGVPSAVALDARPRRDPRR